MLEFLATPLLIVFLSSLPFPFAFGLISKQKTWRLTSTETFGLIGFVLTNRGGANEGF